MNERIKNKIAVNTTTGVHKCCLGLQLFTRKSCFIENGIFATADQTWISINTSDEMMTIAWNCVSGERPETSRRRTGINFWWTFETNNSYNNTKKNLIQ